MQYDTHKRDIEAAASQHNTQTIHRYKPKRRGHQNIRSYGTESFVSAIQ